MKYVAWSGLGYLVEVVGLDSSLCPCLLEEYVDEDWKHLAFADHVFACFSDLDYAQERNRRSFDPRRHQLLAIAREPTEVEVRQTQVEGFRFMGFELIEEATSTSALTNCGGFDGAFEPSDLSTCGLIVDAPRAYEVRAALERLFPDENHAHCSVWAVWQREAG
jgi:hypothetical protein